MPDYREGEECKFNPLVIHKKQNGLTEKCFVLNALSSKKSQEYFVQIPWIRIWKILLVFLLAVLYFVILLSYIALDKYYINS